MDNGDQQLLATLQILQVTKERLPAMAGRAWRMMPWVWEEAEVRVWQTSLEVGVVLEEVREAPRALEADPALTENSKKEEIAGKLTILQFFFQP